MTDPALEWRPGDPVYPNRGDQLACACGVRVLWQPDTPDVCPECGRPLAEAKT